MKPQKKHSGSLNTDPRVERAPGIQRVTLTYDADSMMCYFFLKKGARLEQHTHPQSQSGIVIKGRVKFTKAGGEVLDVRAGGAYYFASGEAHGLEIMEDSEVLECFCPSRDDYKD